MDYWGWSCQVVKSRNVSWRHCIYKVFGYKVFIIEKEIYHKNWSHGKGITLTGHLINLKPTSATVKLLYPHFSFVVISSIIPLNYFYCLFCLPDEFKSFYTRLPQNYFLNVSAIQHLWSLDSLFQWRYEQLENSMRLLSKRANRVIFKLFSLSKRCHRQPQVQLPRDRWAQIQALPMPHFKDVL